MRIQVKEASRICQAHTGGKRTPTTKPDLDSRHDWPSIAEATRESSTQMLFTSGVTQIIVSLLSEGVFAPAVGHDKK